jgi:Cu(I)/Ag(I) efflux system membrane fusion protein
MKRAVAIMAAVGTMLLIAGAGFFLFRARSRAQSPPAVEITPAAAPSGTPRGDVRIDPRRQQLIGVRTVAVVRQTVDQTVRAAGVVRYDETKYADVNVKVEGWIKDLSVDYTGQPIERGQLLFTLYSPDLINAQNEYALALKTRDQLQQSTIADVRERADALVASARQRLIAWDLPAEDVRQLDDTRHASDAVAVRAPVTGVVIEKTAIKGLHVMPGQSLYKIADLSIVWVEADVYEHELAAVRVGDAATVTMDAYPGERFTGRITYIYPFLDEKTRTNKVRVALTNRLGRLKPGMFANVDLTSRGRSGLLVPTDAVLDSGTEQVVFVAQGEGLFQPRPVKIGRRLSRDSIEVLDGLKEGERVVSGATFFLDSESQLRASLSGYETLSPVTEDAVAPEIQIVFRTDPEPAKAGEDQFEAVVTDAAGKPIEDADVNVAFLMPGMPSMNMPAMQSQATLTAAGGGVYRGRGQLVMAGRWDTTITVTRRGQRIGAKQLAVVAR